MATGEIEQLRTGRLVIDWRRLNRSRPNNLIIFDMAFRDDDNRAVPAVPLAAQFLCDRLRKDGLVKPFFMPKPLVEGGELVIHKAALAPGAKLIFALTLFDDHFVETQREVKALKQKFPNAIIILGGPSVNTSKDLRGLASFFPEASAFIKGDGELAIVQLIKGLLAETMARKAFEGMRGAYVRGENFEYCDERPNILTEAELNSYSGTRAYRELVEDINTGGGLDLNTSRDCRYRCVFCSYHYHDKPIYWSAERIIQELRRIKKMIEKGELPEKARRIYFQDDDFLQNRERAIVFLRLLLADKGLARYFSFKFQASLGSLLLNGEVDEELLNLISQAAVRWLYFGTDGFHPETLKYLRKGGYRFEDIEKAISAVCKRGIWQTHYVILTFPEISRETLLRTLENMTRLQAKYSKLVYEFHPEIRGYEGSRLASYLKRRASNDNVIVSELGAEKRLPLRLPLEDQQLQEDFCTVLYEKFPLEGLLKYYVKNASLRKKVLEEYQKKAEKAEEKERGTILSALTDQKLPFLQFCALVTLEAGLTR